MTTMMRKMLRWRTFPSRSFGSPGATSDDNFGICSKTRYRRTGGETQSRLPSAQTEFKSSYGVDHGDRTWVQGMIVPVGAF